MQDNIVLRKAFSGEWTQTRTMLRGEGKVEQQGTIERHYSTRNSENLDVISISKCKEVFHRQLLQMGFVLDPWGMRFPLDSPAALSERYCLGCFLFLSGRVTSPRSHRKSRDHSPCSRWQVRSSTTYNLLIKTPPNTVLFICFHS